MALEAATYVSELVDTNPTHASDRVGQWDDHLRLIKSVLKNSFQNLTGAVTPTHTELNLIDGLTANASELNVMDGITVTVAELNYAAGLTSAFQTQIATKRADLTTSVKTDSFNASVGNRYILRTATLKTVTLPTTSLTAGDQIVVINNSGGVWSISAGSVPTNGTADASYLLANTATLKLMYVDSTTGWARFQQST